MIEQIKQISDVIWEIPTSYKKGMRVPARIFATKKLLEEMDKGVFEQLTNVATLPGIQRFAFCMPDGHWGYGFPIGGVAAFDVETGVISPGGIGFDINCLAGNSKIQLNHGCYKKIEALESDFSKHKISFMDLDTKEKMSGVVAMFLKKKPDCKVLKIITESGGELILTEDHPVFTGKEFIDAGKLKEGSVIVTHPFEGVEYQEPSNEIILDEKDIVAIVGEREDVVENLKQRGFLPLRENSNKLPIITKLLGFLTGDGWLGKYYNKKRKQYVWSMRAIGKCEDLEEIRKDICSLGYKVSFIKTKKYESNIKEVSGRTRKISGNSTQLHIMPQSLAILMKALGLPEGNKSRTAFCIPKWIKKAPLWIKRLYLAGLFGAELTTPTQRKGEQFRFAEPSFSQNKIFSLEKEGKKFVLEISDLLSEFGVNINKIYKYRIAINSYGEETVKISLKISAKTENLINLWSKIGHEYCTRRQRNSALAVAYLKKKRAMLRGVEKFLKDSKVLLENGMQKSVIYALAESRGLSVAMIKGQLSRKNNSQRISAGFPTFEEFTAQANLNSEFVLDKIEKIEEANYDDYIYDFTMDDNNHNFIANNIVTHNCGMRLIRTNLTINDVKPKLKELVDIFFRTVPAGVGASGFVKANRAQFQNVMTEGVKWCVDNGYGWKQDLERIEENGQIKGADPSKVSEKALKRGIDQLGTLGSGNHYLEIQVAEKIHDPATAKVFGFEQEGQIGIMIHCGSRGFGHQVGTDYLQIFDSAMRKYGITVPDRELACAPFSSKEGQDYYHAMACAANMAFVNRQVILHRIREGFSKVFKKPAEELGLELVYDVAHNIAKIEEHLIEGKKYKVVMHRKGATRCFGPNRPEVPQIYRQVGQPVIIGGSMETGSYLLVGTEKAMQETFASTMHGSGRTMSRTAAVRAFRGSSLQKEMEMHGIIVKAVSMSGLAEEAGAAYKNINEVVDTMEIAGISRKAVQLRPLGNVKG